MRLLAWIIMVPVAIAVVSFAVNNRGDITVDLWPAPYVVDAPLFAVVMLSMVVGIGVGGFISWMSAGRTRGRARASARRAAAAEREAEVLRQQVAATEGGESETTDRDLPARIGGS